MVRPNPTSMFASTRSATRCRSPATIWASRCESSGSGCSSRSGMDAMTAAATAKLAASTRATSQPPVHANSAAPRSGPKIRNASFVVCRLALASTRRSSGTISLSSPLSAAGSTTNEMP